MLPKRPDLPTAARRGADDGAVDGADYLISREARLALYENAIGIALQRSCLNARWRLGGTCGPRAAPSPKALATTHRG